jgi:predicted hydrolase (HD superfamily)
MQLPTATEARNTLHHYVTDPYQRIHAEMVAAAVAGYASQYNANTTLWWLTGLWHDLDYDLHPDTHPGPALAWLEEWGYPEEMIHAIEAHAEGFNGFTTTANSDLARVLRACDEICGIFYAYRKLNPIPYQDMKVKSIKKRLAENKFAPGIDREHIYTACTTLDIDMDTHIQQLIDTLPEPNHA